MGTEVIPANDPILTFISSLPVWQAYLLLVVPNYAITVALVRRAGTWKAYSRDYTYHISWLIVVPVMFVFLAPEAYRASQEMFIEIGGNLLSFSDGSYLASIRDTQRGIHNSQTIALLGAFIGIALVFGWLSVFKRTTNLGKKSDSLYFLARLPFN